MKGGADTQRVQHANATEGKRCVLCRVSIKNWVCAYMYWKPVFYAHIYELSWVLDCDRPGPRGSRSRTGCRSAGGPSRWRGLPASQPRPPMAPLMEEERNCPQSVDPGRHTGHTCYQRWASDGAEPGSVAREQSNCSASFCYAM